jgi:hypothetical protein
VANPKALTPIRPTAEAVLAFAPVCQVNPYGAVQSPAELVAGCYLFEYAHHDQAALVALSFGLFSGGNRVHINALQSMNPAAPIQMRQVMAAIESTAFAMGADVLTLSTQHKAIAAGAARWGGHISGAVVAKYLGRI